MGITNSSLYCLLLQKYLGRKGRIVFPQKKKKNPPRTLENDLIYRYNWGKDLNRKSYCIWLSSKSNDGYPYKRQKSRKHTETQGRRPCERWRQSKATPGITTSWKRQGRILPKSLQRQYRPANTLISDFQPPKLREYFSVVLSAKYVLICYHSSRKLIKHVSTSHFCTHAKDSEKKNVNCLLV